MKQLGLTGIRLMKRARETRQERFLEEMDPIIPWKRLPALALWFRVGQCVASPPGIRHG